MTHDHRLLIVDDQEAILFAMSEYLRGRGFEVDCASTREDAQAALAANLYSAVIADLRLDPSDNRGGLRLLRWVRENRPETRTLLLTAFGTPSIEAEMRAIGADLLLSKPLPMASIADEVSRLLELNV
ncbi:MAG TPA: response regulator [Thermoanaerobaculia bacterium]|nr:response regulator [Thermoanaerobaculia bacterium]